jgi:3-hydroxyacyl-CoA dehydrogenase
VKKFIHGSLDRIETTTELNDAVDNADLVIEAIVENLKVKQELFASIDDVSNFLQHRSET